MLFNEPIFFIFFALVFSVYWLVRHNGSRKTWLLAASYTFYAAWDWRFLFLIFTSTLIDYAVGLILRHEKPVLGRKAWLIVSLCANLGILGFFKYFNFFVTSAGEFLDMFGVSTGDRSLNIILPVGIRGLR